MKEPCKYHPGEQAVWYCPNDGIHFCNDCVAMREGPDGEQAVCFLCNKNLKRIARGVAEAPFWQILAHFIQYPLARDSLLFAAVIALVAAVVPGGLPGAGIVLAAGLVAGRMGNQMFDRTVEGQMRPPAWSVLTDSAGWEKAVQQWLVFVAACAGLGYCYIRYGMMAGSGIAFLAWLLLPAILIQLQLEGSLLNMLFGLPRLFGTMISIGVDYFLAGPLLFIGFTAVATAASIAHDLLPAFLGWPVAALLGVWFWYATMHLLGYLTCQHREALGYVSEASEAEARKKRARRPEEERRLAVWLREGRYRKVVQYYHDKLEKQGKSLALNDQYYRLLSELDDRDTMLEHAATYLRVLLDNKQEFRVGELLKHYRELDPAFRPDGAQLTRDVAQVLVDNGDAKAAVQLLQDLHKRAPTWPGLPEAYLLIARLLAQQFNLTGKAQQYIRFVETRFREVKAQEMARACREELGLAKA